MVKDKNLLPESFNIIRLCGWKITTLNRRVGAD
jgi:hypothetical protein